MNIYQAVQTAVELVKRHGRNKFVVPSYTGYHVVDKIMGSDCHYYLFTPTSIQDNAAIEYRVNHMTGETTEKIKKIYR